MIFENETEHSQYLAYWCNDDSIIMLIICGVAVIISGNEFPGVFRLNRNYALKVVEESYSPLAF